MNYLLDTQLLLWTSAASERLSERAAEVVDAEASRLAFSAASIWEVAIKAALGRTDFEVDPQLLRVGLIEAGFDELPIDGEDAAAVRDLEPIHRDPFDRLLVAQTRRRGLVLLTSDVTVARYRGSIELV